MIDLSKRKSVIGGLISMGIAICIISLVGFIVYKIGKTPCSKEVTLTTGETFTVEWINAYSSGVADMKKCSGERVQYPIRSIESVRDIEE
jgi:hypothetical protein